MKKLFLIILLFTSLKMFGQSSVPDAYRTPASPLSGANKNNKAQWDANLYVPLSFRIPRSLHYTLNGAKDTAGYIMLATDINKLGIYRGGGVWDTLATTTSVTVTTAITRSLSDSSTFIANTAWVKQYSASLTAYFDTTLFKNTGSFGNPISIKIANSTQTGVISYIDWGTFNNKQALLVSGTNIKTINGSSILGGGNLVVGGGSTGINGLNGTANIGLGGTITGTTIVHTGGNNFKIDNQASGGDGLLVGADGSTSIKSSTSNYNAVVIAEGVGNNGVAEYGVQDASTANRSEIIVNGFTQRMLVIDSNWSRGLQYTKHQNYDIPSGGSLQQIPDVQLVDSLISAGSVNIYTGDGSLAGNRAVNTSTNYLYMGNTTGTAYTTFFLRGGTSSPEIQLNSIGGVYLNSNSLVTGFGGNFIVDTTRVKINWAGSLGTTKTIQIDASGMVVTDLGLNVGLEYGGLMSLYTTNQRLKRASLASVNTVIALADSVKATISSGGISTIAIASSNGFTGSSSGGSTPTLTIATSITGILKGNGTAISAATAGTDYVIPSALSAYVPYTGATTDLTLGTNNISAKGVYITDVNGAGLLSLATQTAGVGYPGTGFTSVFVNTSNQFTVYSGHDGYQYSFSDGLVSGNTTYTLPASSGTIATLANSETLTNKNLSSGTNTFPTFNQNTTGNAATATKLATARNINGVAFDGTGNITITAAPSGTIGYANGGTNSTTTWTTGSVFFAGASAFAQDNANFFWDATNHRLGIGNAIPSVGLQVTETGTSTIRGFIVDQSTTDAIGAKIYERKLRGTEASPTTIVTGDVLGAHTFSGYTNAFTDAARILVTSTGTVSSGIIPAILEIQTATTAGTLTDGIKIDQAQQLTFGGYSTTGLAHLSSSGAVTSSLIINADITNSTIDLTAKVTGVLPSANGGTSFSTYTTGDIFYASATNVLSKLAIGSSTNVLTVSGGVPAWTAAPTGAISSVSNSDGTLTISPTTGAVVASIALTHANTWSNQTFTTPVINGLPTGTGIASAATASTLAARDANGSSTFNGILNGQIIAAANGTTTLTVSSPHVVTITGITGVTTQTVVMPVATTLTAGETYLIVLGGSSGTAAIESSGTNAIIVPNGGMSVLLTCVNPSGGTGTASWLATLNGFSNFTGSNSTVALANGPTFTNTTTMATAAITTANVTSLIAGGTGNNIYIPNQGNITHTTNSQFQIAGSSASSVRVAFGGTSTGTMTSADNYINTLVTNAPITTGTGTAPWLMQLGINSFGTITNGGTITNTAMLYLGSASSAGTNNFSIYSTSGNVQINNGNLTLGTAGNRLFIATGTGSPVGDATLSSGTVSITIAGLTSSSRAQVTRTVASGTTLTTGITAVCTTNTLTITADVAAGTINTADNSTYTYFIVN